MEEGGGLVGVSVGEVEPVGRERDLVEDQERRPCQISYHDEAGGHTVLHEGSKGMEEGPPGTLELIHIHCRSVDVSDLARRLVRTCSEGEDRNEGHDEVVVPTFLVLHEVAHQSVEVRRGLVGLVDGPERMSVIVTVKGA